MSKIIFKGFEGYDVLRINDGIWHSKTNSWCPSFTHHLYLSGRSDTILRTVQNTPALHVLCSGSKAVKEDPVLSQQLYTFQKGDTLFFHKGCKIPKLNSDGNWKRAIKLDKAKAVVVPDIKRVTFMHDYAIFPFPETKTVYLMKADDPDREVNVGDTLGDVFNENGNTVYAGFFHRYSEDLDVLGKLKCTYRGDITTYSPSDEYVFDILDGTYKTFIYEKDLTRSIGGEGKEFTLDIVNSIKDMLNSDDKESVHLGMRMLAGLDYAHHPAITRYILKETERGWDRFKPFNSAVAYMMSKDGVNFQGRWQEPFYEVMPEEFPLAKDIYISIVDDEMKSTLWSLNRATNMEVDCKFDINISMKDADGNVIGDYFPIEDEEEVAEEPTAAEQELIDMVPEKDEEVGKTTEQLMLDLWPE